MTPYALSVFVRMLVCQANPDAGGEGALAVVPDDMGEEAAKSMLSTVVEIWKDFFDQLPLILLAMLLLVITWVIGHFTESIAARLLRGTKMRRSLQELVGRLIYIVVWIVGLTITAMVVFPGLTPTKALAGLGLGSVAVGLAFKDIFENFFAGILILWRFPFENGDFIECEGIMGKVEDVTIRNTFIRQTTGELVVVPNSTIFKNPVEVLTHWPWRRVTVIAGVAYGEDVDESRAVIRKAVEGCASVNKDQPIEIFAQEFADSSINFEVTWWTKPTPRDIRASRNEVVAAVKRALDTAGIEIPFPYRTLTFKEPLRLEGKREA